MIARLIERSARNLMLVMVATAFAVMAGVWRCRHLPLDAIPDLSDTQVIVYTEYPGQAPQVVEDQVTYPLTTAMLTVPRSRVVRGFSFFGVSFVYVIFEDGTDIYWARSRVLEYLNAAAPSGCRRGHAHAGAGRDRRRLGLPVCLVATNRSLAELRSLQDWELRFGLAKAEGVAEVASVGGFVKQYNVVIDPGRLRSSVFRCRRCATRSAPATWMSAAARSSFPSPSSWCAGAAISKASPDLERSCSRRTAARPCCCGRRARGARTRRAARIAELNGEGEVASGIVLQRFGANALDVIDDVKARLAEIAPACPTGVEILPVYDRSDLIHARHRHAQRTLIEESVIVALVCIVFLLHVRSALVAILMLPVGVLMAFAAMKALGLGSNIMSLGGIAIAIGAMVDAAIVMIENAHKHLERSAARQAERVVGGYYLEIIPDRKKLARYGLMIEDVQDVVATALGAEPVTTTVEGRERYTVAIRYPRDLRSDPQSIAKDVLVALPGGVGTVPLGEVADIRRTQGATSIRTENTRLATYIFVDIRDRDR